MHIRLRHLRKYLSSRFGSFPRPGGQGLVETALLFPVLLIVISSLIEFGFLLNEYLALQDAARNAARFQADGLYYAGDSGAVNNLCYDADGDGVYDPRPCCAVTVNFYRQGSCLVMQELAQERPEIELDFSNGDDDVVISAFSVAQGFCSGMTCVTVRHPNGTGWSQSNDIFGGGNQTSSLSTAEINSKLQSLAPSTGLVAVEVFYDYDQKLKLPWITAFLPDPILLHNYTIMPLVSAEPTPTPPSP
jgi:hypothetical protein